ncbi:MAG: hypothetical protein AB1630_09730 [bacterium]
MEQTVILVSQEKQAVGYISLVQTTTLLAQIPYSTIRVEMVEIIQVKAE